MSLAIDVQSWYASKIIKDILVNPQKTYDLLNNDSNKYIEKIKSSIKHDAKKEFIHPNIQIFSIKNNDNESYLFDIPAVDKENDSKIYIFAIFRFKKNIFSKELISSSATKLVNEFFDEKLFEVISYISLPPYVMFNARNLGFLHVDNLHTIVDDMKVLTEDIRFSSRWIWSADPNGGKDQDMYFLEKNEFLHSKYKDFENKKLFEDIKLLVNYHSVLILSVFSMLSNYKILSQDKCEIKKNEFRKLLSNCYVSTLFLGLEDPWNETSTNSNYHIEIRRMINILIYYSYKTIQESIELLPKGNKSGIVELSLDVYNCIRQIIEWTYWFAPNLQRILLTNKL